MPLNEQPPAVVIVHGGFAGGTAESIKGSHAAFLPHLVGFATIARGASS